MTKAARDLHTAPAPLQRRVLLAYGIGDAGTGMASALVGFYLFVFYTDVAGLPAWLAGTVLMVVRLWDVFSDQLIGWLGDRTRHRLGPRVPWMLWGALPVGTSMALMGWAPPFTGTWRLVWFVLIAALFQMSYALVNLPYSGPPCGWCAIGCRSARNGPRTGARVAEGRSVRLGRFGLADSRPERSDRQHRHDLYRLARVGTAAIQLLPAMRSSLRRQLLHLATDLSTTAPPAGSPMPAASPCRIRCCRPAALAPTPGCTNACATPTTSGMWCAGARRQRQGKQR